MKVLRGLKHTFLALTFVSLVPAGCSARVQSPITVSESIGWTMAGAALIASGLCIVNEIPLTSLDEISLSFRNQLSKDNLRKLHLGRAIQGYTLAGVGSIISFLGVCALITAKK